MERTTSKKEIMMKLTVLMAAFVAMLTFTQLIKPDLPLAIHAGSYCTVAAMGGGGGEGGEKKAGTGGTFSWDTFKTSLENLANNGLAENAFPGIGTLIMVVGIVTAVVSFVVHKFNPQSRMPGWITCLGIAIIGSLAASGISGPMNLVNSMRSWFSGALGM